MAILKFIYTTIQNINSWCGKIISILIYPMMFFMLYEIVSRYLFGRPTIWVYELSTMIYAIYFLSGGAYALRQNAHVNVEIFYARLPIRRRAILDLFTWSIFYLFCGTILIFGTEYAYSSIVHLEHSTTPWNPPIWPINIFIPLSAFLLLLQGINKTIKDILIIINRIDLLD
jgi:TRAP-type mannitol/chloroaromatic compound transport system permease small subunit